MIPQTEEEHLQLNLNFENDTIESHPYFSGMGDWSNIVKAKAPLRFERLVIRKWKLLYAPETLAIRI